MKNKAQRPTSNAQRPTSKARRGEAREGGGAAGADGSFGGVIAAGGFSNVGISGSAALLTPGHLAGSAFDAANWSSRRGYIYLPNTDSRKDLTEGNRTEMLKRGRWLVKNVGFAKRCIWGFARMCGWMSPRPLTGDKPWNKAAADKWERTFGSTLGFDAMGRHNVYSHQVMATAGRLQDGDFFPVFAYSNAGQPLVMSYEGHQIGNGNGPAEGWDDGVRTNRQGRALQYRVLDLEESWRDLPARDVVHMADFLSVNHRRGASALHHAINHLLDRTELVTDLKTGSKIANRQAMYVVNQLPQQPNARVPAGMTVASGQPTIQTDTQWAMQDLYNPERSGGKVVELRAGQELRTLLDSRPHPNTLEFLDYLCRDIASGMDMPSEVLWNIAKLGGASVRYVMGDAQKAIERQQQLNVDQYLTRLWVWAVSVWMANGELPPCEDPHWYKVGWQAPAKLTVDVGRDGRLSIDLHQSGMLTLAKWYGSQGEDWEDEITQSVEEYAFKMKACAEIGAKYNLTIRPEMVWPGARGSVVPVGPESVVDPVEEPPVDEVDVEKAA